MLFYLYDDCVRLPLRVYLTATEDIKSVRLMRTGQEIPFKKQGSQLLLDTTDVDRNSAFYADCFILEAMP